METRVDIFSMSADGLLDTRHNVKDGQDTHYRRVKFGIFINSGLTSSYQALCFVVINFESQKRSIKELYITRYLIKYLTGWLSFCSNPEYLAALLPQLGDIPFPVLYVILGICQKCKFLTVLLTNMAVEKSWFSSTCLESSYKV